MECVSKERKINSAFACLAARYKKIENKISDIFLTQVKSSIFAPAFKEAFLLKADSVAQLVEHYTFNVVVLGSNPSGITTKSPSRNLLLGDLSFNLPDNTSF